MFISHSYVEAELFQHFDSDLLECRLLSQSWKVRKKHSRVYFTDHHQNHENILQESERFL